MKASKYLGIALSVVLAATVAACNQSESGGSGSGYPNKDLDWTVAFGPGGGNDKLARKLVDILKKDKLYPNNIAVENREGGSGATGWGYLTKKKGDGYAISTTSGSFITSPLVAKTGFTYRDFTHVGLLASDALFFIVKKDTGISTWQQWVDKAKQKGSVTIAGIGEVNVDFIVADILAEKAGFKMAYVPFDDQGELITALTSDAVDGAVSNPSEVIGQLDSGDLVALMFTGKEALPKYRDVPTAQSLGYPGLPTMPRGLILPPDAPKEATDWWIETMRKVVETPDWKAYVEDSFLAEDLRWGPDFTKYLDETNLTFEIILKARKKIPR
ncbi:Bug family tripartite tricarboxylate transporter substrate binding protein [Kibdelosporangium aridum]|uniref:Bug family tripartite tricarboxylate transporter substrate binding protein n=1 Tax=Kibdelosporangium aridum TaxID=2030 RepID=UPI0035ED76D8